MTVTILRKIRHDRDFVQVQNATIRDGRLSFRATGLHVYLLSLPDGSRIDSTTLAARKREGRDAIRTAYRELEEAGYVERTKEQNDEGQWVTITNVREVSPGTDSQSSGTRSPEGQALPTGKTTGNTKDGASSRPGLEPFTPLPDERAPDSKARARSLRTRNRGV